MKRSELRQIIKEELMSEDFSHPSAQKYFRYDVMDQLPTLIKDIEIWLDELNSEMGYDVAEKTLKGLKKQVNKMKL